MLHRCEQVERYPHGTVRSLPVESPPAALLPSPGTTDFGMMESGLREFGTAEFEAASAACSVVSKPMELAAGHSGRQSAQKRLAEAG